MDLNRAHADAEVESNLLVRSTRNQGVKNLPLTRTERRDPVSSLGGRARPVRPAPPGQRPLDGAQQHVFLEWLLDEVDGAGLHGLHGGLNVALAGHDDNGQRYAELVEAILQLQPVHAGHPYV